MATRAIDSDPTKHLQSEDWEGNNAAFTCPKCTKVFIVSQMLHKGTRQCPSCGKSTGHVEGGRKNPDGRAYIEWMD